jgi:tetratricopeptide (TPR) repeat protein
MARRAQSASPKQPQRERQAEDRWWKTPAVIAAVIAALAAISIAIINQRATSTPKTSDTSPIAGVQGSVTVTKDVAVTASGSGTAIMQTGSGSLHLTNIHGISAEEHTRLSQELGVTNSALKSFFKVLEQQHVPREDLDSTLRDIAKRYQELQDKLRTFTSDDPAVVALKQAASKALEAGDFAQVETLLNEASQKDLEGAQQFQQMATKRWLSAAASKAELGTLKDTQLRYTEAAAYHRQAAEWVESLPKGSEEILATYLNNWAESSLQAGDYRSAEPPFRRALALWEQASGPNHPDVAIALNNLAELYRAQGRYAEAEPLYQRALAIFEKTLGPDHPNVAMSLSNLAALYNGQGRYGEAEPLLKRALATFEKALGPEHQGVFYSLNNLGWLYNAQGRYGEAEPLYQRALAIFEKTLGPDHPNVAISLENYAVMLRATNRVSEADELDIRAKTIRAKYTQEHSVE